MLQWDSRTHCCGELSENDVRKRVVLCGWVALYRIHGGLTFVNRRDKSGLVQITTLPDEFPDAHSTVTDLRLEYVIAVEGVVRPRPAESVNKKMKTGVIEVAAEDVQMLNAVKLKLPFLVTTADDAKDSVREEIRLRNQCLDLRRPQMNSNIMLRYSKIPRRHAWFYRGRLRLHYHLDLLLKVLVIIWFLQGFSQQHFLHCPKVRSCTSKC